MNTCLLCHDMQPLFDGKVTSPEVACIQGLALCSLLLSQNIPARPVAGNEVKWGLARADA